MSDRALSMLVYGASKTGKTTLATTAPKPLLLLDVEAASRFVPGRKVKWTPMDGSAPPVDDGTWDICVVDVHSYDALTKSYEWLKSGKHPFKSVVVDSISEAQAKAKELVGNRAKMQTQHWGTLLDILGYFARDMRDLTTNPVKPIQSVVIIATEIENGGVHKPYLQGQIASQVPFLFDLCGYYFASQEVDESNNIVEHRDLLIAKHPEYEAGNRVPGLPSVIRDPNIKDLLDAIFGPEEEEV